MGLAERILTPKGLALSMLSLAQLNLLPLFTDTSPPVPGPLLAALAGVQLALGVGLGYAYLAASSGACPARRAGAMAVGTLLLAGSAIASVAGLGQLEDALLIAGYAGLAAGVARCVGGAPGIAASVLLLAIYLTLLGFADRLTLALAWRGAPVYLGIWSDLAVLETGGYGLPPAGLSLVHLASILGAGWVLRMLRGEI